MRSHSPEPIAVDPTLHRGRWHHRIVIFDQTASTASVGVARTGPGQFSPPGGATSPFTTAGPPCAIAATRDSGSIGWNPEGDHRREAGSFRVVKRCRLLAGQPLHVHQRSRKFSALDLRDGEPDDRREFRARGPCTRRVDLVPLAGRSDGQYLPDEVTGRRVQKFVPKVRCRRIA